MKRSDRLISLTNFFLENPMVHRKITFFAKEYGSAKSSISEDLNIINHMFQTEGIGYLKRMTGSGGGVIFIPKMGEQHSLSFINMLCEKLADPVRILPGGYLYMSDLLGEPKTVREIGRIFASKLVDLNIEVVVTVATKGIPLAYAVASFLNVPVVIVRRDPKVTEGSSVTINYISGSSRKIQTMVLPKRSLQEGSNVCIIDDFMKAGGTINGMISLLGEFNANVQAIGVLAEADDEEEVRVVEEYISLIKISDINENQIQIVPGNIVASK